MLMCIHRTYTFSFIQHFSDSKNRLVDSNMQIIVQNWDFIPEKHTLSGEGNSNTQNGYGVNDGTIVGYFTDIEKLF